ncbi:MAG: threonine/homoserine/homoserine lactone efflux protein [Paraglaciecola sp.]|jgi:threonine/homoserine/homoserine lactone efflux protein
MTLEIITALMLFAFVSSITPGPNNLMLMASGANFGFRRTLPHLLGVGLGFTLMVVLVGLGIMQLFDLYPLSYQVLKVLSVTYLLYLAYKIAISGSPSENRSARVNPMTFLQAMLFQWVNPKAWTMALTAISVYAPSKSVMAVVLVALVFGAVNLPCISSWTALGQKLQRLLTNKKRLRLFNFSMATLLVLSLYPVLL